MKHNLFIHAALIIVLSHHVNFILSMNSFNGIGYRNTVSSHAQNKKNNERYLLPLYCVPLIQAQPNWFYHIKIIFNIIIKSEINTFYEQLCGKFDYKTVQSDLGREYFPFLVVNKLPELSPHMYNKNYALSSYIDTGIDGGRYKFLADIDLSIPQSLLQYLTGVKNLSFFESLAVEVACLAAQKEYSNELHVQLNVLRDTCVDMITRKESPFSHRYPRLHEFSPLKTLLNRNDRPKEENISLKMLISVSEK